MSEHWITVKEAAVYCDCKENTIRKQIERGLIQYKYVPGRGRGGKQLRILLESLSPEVQEKYLNSKNKPAPHDASEAMLNKLPEDKRDTLNEKLLITQEYIKFRNQCLHKDHLRKFVKYMKKNYPMFEFNPDILCRWVAKYEKYGIAGLIDLRGRRSNRKTSLTKEMQDMFLRYYLSDKEPSIKQCYDAVANNIPDKLPSISSFKRFLYTIPDSTLAYYRKGNKFFEDNYLPSIHVACRAKYKNVTSKTQKKTV